MISLSFCCLKLTIFRLDASKLAFGPRMVRLVLKMLLRPEETAEDGCDLRWLLFLTVVRVQVVEENVLLFKVDAEE